MDSLNANSHVVFKEMKQWFNSLEEQRTEFIKEFYKRLGIHERNGKLDIIVSIDGSYTKRSYRKIYNSIYCITFVFDCITGTCIDYEIVERCIDPEYPGTSTAACGTGKFHGSSKSMEVSAALNLYKKTQQKS